DCVVVLLEDVVAAANLADLLARHPDLLANPLAGALHAGLDDLAGAVARAAGARVEDPLAGRPAAASHHRARAVVLLLAPVARADLVALFLPDRLARAGLADHRALLGHFLDAADRHFLDVLLVDRFVGDALDRHLVLLPDRLVDDVAVLA